MVPRTPAAAPDITSQDDPERQSMYGGQYVEVRVHEAALAIYAALSAAESYAGEGPAGGRHDPV